MIRLERKVDQLLDMERERAAGCAAHTERLNHLEQSDRDLWEIVGTLRRHIYIGIGLLLAFQFFGALLIAHWLR